MRSAQLLFQRARETGVPPWRLATRVAVSAGRRLMPGLRTVAVPIDDRGTRILADLNRPFGLSLYRYGFPEPEARLLQILLRPGDVFVDGGAHIGVFTLLAAALVGATGRVVSCEPVPENMQLLEANIALNGFAWVDTHMVALGARSGVGMLYSFGTGSALSSYAPADHTGSVRTPVEIKTLDEVAEGLGPRLRLVKLDIEGAELAALRGAAALLRVKPDFLLELEPEHLARQNATVEDLQTLFSEAGYKGFEIRGDRRDVTLVPMESWCRPVGNPNLLVSARVQPLAATATGVNGDGSVFGR